MEQEPIPTNHHGSGPHANHRPWKENPKKPHTLLNPTAKLSEARRNAANAVKPPTTAGASVKPTTTRRGDAQDTIEHKAGRKHQRGHPLPPAIGTRPTIRRKGQAIDTRPTLQAGRNRNTHYHKPSARGRRASGKARLSAQGRHSKPGETKGASSGRQGRVRRTT